MLESIESPIENMDAADAVIALMMQAGRVRRAVEAELRPHGISFALWWVLYVTHRLQREAADAVPQHAIVLATELGKGTVSYLMGILGDRQLVDRGPDGLAWAYRIIVTRAGAALLSETCAALATGLRLSTEAPADPSRALRYCLSRCEI